MISTSEVIALALSCGQPECKCGWKSGRGYLTHCPAHRDDTPSLSVSSEEQGKILVKCVGGCSQEMVIEALKAKGLWPNKESSENEEGGKSSGKQRNTATPARLILEGLTKSPQRSRP